MDIIQHALNFAWMAHDGQYRRYPPNTPYFTHCVMVAEWLKWRNHPPDVVAAGYLHDVIEDTKFDLNDIKINFGLHIASLVEMVTDISKLEDGNRAARKAMDRDHVARASAEGQTIKLADIIDNTRNIVDYDPGFAKIYLPEKAELLRCLPLGDWQLHQAARAILLNGADRLGIEIKDPATV